MELSAGKTEALARYIERLEATIKRTKKSSLFTRFARARALKWLKDRILGSLRMMECTRYSKKFMRQPEVRKRFRIYYHTSLNEVERLHRQYGLEIPTPTHVVFGHTHQPIPWGSEELLDQFDGKLVRFSNTGGWLQRKQDGAVDFVGAEVLVYESGKGIQSVSIGSADLLSGVTTPRERYQVE
jgi:hypothetical protein